MNALFIFEVIAIAYFTALAVAAPFMRRRVLNAWRTALTAAALAVSILMMSAILSAPARMWLAHGYLAAGYWLPALLVTDTSPRVFEAWLVRTDVWWRWARLNMGPAAAHIFELSYLLCYVLVPMAFVAVWAMGTSSDVDRFWTAVLAAGFACYGTLPWLIARPPRVIDDQDASRAVRARAANLFVLSRVSHGHNTFPSGHVAVSVAAALMTLPVSRGAGLVMLVLAAGIAAGATAGRYHYAIDVLLGAAIGVVASIVA